jgi:hypothetical protein
MSNNIHDHPNSGLRKEIEMLKARIRVLESQDDQHAKALLMYAQKFDSMKDLLLRSLHLMAVTASKNSEKKE